MTATGTTLNGFTRYRLPYVSTEDYTTTEKSKLASLSNYNDAEVRELISALRLRLTTLSEDLESLEARVAALETPAA